MSALLRTPKALDLRDLLPAAVLDDLPVRLLATGFMNRPG